MNENPDTVNSLLTEILAEQRAIRATLSAGPQRWLSICEAGQYANVSKSSIEHLLASGKLQANRLVPGRVLIDKNELDNAIRSSTATRRRRGRGAKS